jgi:hypothetical protein
MLRKLVLAWAAWRMLRALLPILAAAAVLLMLVHARGPLVRHRSPVLAHQRHRAVVQAHRAYHLRQAPR